jgi:hypothetical protein
VQEKETTIAEQIAGKEKSLAQSFAQIQADKSSLLNPAF